MNKPSFFTRIRQVMARAIAPKPTSSGRSAFASAATSRLSADWMFAGARSANQDLLGDLRTLRDRSRDLARNSPWVKRFLQILAEKVVGPNGITLQAKNQLRDGSGLHTRANAGIEAAWRQWTRPENCDITRRHSLTEILQLAVSGGWGQDGEVLILLHEGVRSNGWGFALQLLDPDLLDETWNRPATANENAIVQGVEVDAFGAPVAYWLWTRHPSEAGYDRVRRRVDARYVIHDFLSARPGQARGIPMAATVAQQIKMLDGYHEAELVAARTASATMGSIEVDPEKAGGFDPSAGSSDIPMEVEPGALLRLNPGEKLALWDPQHPTQAFSEFTRVTLHAIAAGLGVSYGTLTGDLSQANYSSMRVGMLDERDHWSVLTQRLITHVLDRVFSRWIEFAILNQKIANITGFDASQWTRIQWQTRGFDWIDPVKDVQGDLYEVAAGVKTLTEMAAERGRDLEEIIEERQLELKKLEAAGVPSVLYGTNTPADAKSETGKGADAQEKASAIEVATREGFLAGQAQAREGLLASALVTLAERELPTPHVEVHNAPPAVRVDVAPPSVEVTVQPGQRTAKEIVRDANGAIIRIVDAPLGDEVAA